MIYNALDIDFIYGNIHDRSRNIGLPLVNVNDPIGVTNASRKFYINNRWLTFDLQINLIDMTVDHIIKYTSQF